MFDSRHQMFIVPVHWTVLLLMCESYSSCFVRHKVSALSWQGL